MRLPHHVRHPERARTLCRSLGGALTHTQRARTALHGACMRARTHTHTQIGAKVKLIPAAHTTGGEGVCVRVIAPEHSCSSGEKMIHSNNVLHN